MMVSVAWVKERQERLGGGLGLTQEMSLRSLKPSCCMAKPTEWMTWAVPETQMEPLGFQDALRGGEPGAVELMDIFNSGPYRAKVGAAGFVPITFVDGDHFAGVAGDAAVGEEVRRGGQEEVDGIVGDGCEC